MAEEKELTLKELGLEDTPTPAEQAEQQSKTIQDPQSGTNIEVIQSNIDPTKVENDWKPSSMEYTDKDGNHQTAENRVIPKPGNNINGTRNERNSKYKHVDINSFAKIPIRKEEEENPIRKTLDSLYEMADSNIQRTEKELTAPGGRIDQAKHEYIEHQWRLLQKRARSSKSLAKHIKAIENIMDTDARFDGATDYLRKGYIIFKVAHDEKVGINDETFGITSTMKASGPRNSSDSEKFDPLSLEDDEERDLSGDKFIIGEETSAEIPFEEDKPEEESEEVPMITEEHKDPEVEIAREKQAAKEKQESGVDAPVVEEPVQPVNVIQPKEENVTTNKTSIEDINKNIPIKSEEEIKKEKEENSSDYDLIGVESEEEKDESSEIQEVEDETELTEEEIKERRKAFKAEVINALNLDRRKALEGFTISNSTISLNRSLDSDAKERKVEMNITWGLQYTGTSFEITPLSGQELIKLNPEITNFRTVNGLRTVFSIFYRHFNNPNKPKFETWIKQISDFDVDCMFFGAYYATFKDNNFITYECPKCKKAFIEKKDCIDMVKYPNDKVKERFKQILDKDTVGTKLYKTRPFMINYNYAVGFVTQSIYSNLFEPAALSQEFKDKYDTIINIMPNIDRIYRIDHENKTLVPIYFGVIEKDLTKTVQRKVRGLNDIISKFTPDERALLLAEAQKIATVFNDDVIRYEIPPTTCPNCHTKIKGVEENPLNLLFIRARLPIAAASIPE